MPPSQVAVESLVRERSCRGRHRQPGTHRGGVGLVRQQGTPPAFGRADSRDGDQRPRRPVRAQRRFGRHRGLDAGLAALVGQRHQGTGRHGRASMSGQPSERDRHDDRADDGGGDTGGRHGRRATPGATPRTPDAPSRQGHDDARGGESGKHRRPGVEGAPVPHRRPAPRAPPSTPPPPTRSPATPLRQVVGVPSPPPPGRPDAGTSSRRCLSPRATDRPRRTRRWRHAMR